MLNTKISAYFLIGLFSNAGLLLRRYGGNSKTSYKLIDYTTVYYAKPDKTENRRDVKHTFKARKMSLAEVLSNGYKPTKLS